jgi:DNA-binding NarL/FixJ family response regulator
MDDQRLIRVVIADDHELCRVGLRTVLDEPEDVRVVGEAADGREAIDQVRRHAPEVVILNVSMPRLNGAEAAREILRESPGTRICALSGHRGYPHVAAMARAGAQGYVSKARSAGEVLQAVRELAAGRTFYSLDVAQGLPGEYVSEHGDARPAGVVDLTPREREVLQLVAEGHSSKEIARELFVTTKTVQFHRQRIMDKLGLHSVASLTKFAVRHGVSPLDA